MPSSKKALTKQKSGFFTLGNCSNGRSFIRVSESNYFQCKIFIRAADMTDVDIFAKLSRILETHDVSAGDDEDGDVMDLLQRIEKDGNKEDKMGAANTKNRNKM